MLSHSEGCLRLSDITSGPIYRAHHVLMEAAVVAVAHESRRLILADLKNALVSGTVVLENLPETKKVWYPFSSRQVLELAHSSLRVPRTLYCMCIDPSYSRTYRHKSRTCHHRGRVRHAAA